ncbi:MAG: isopeptide-forming domain-containing fimbrial protein, partial [Cytophagaceae bacterium]|nr:isopeptide-forming domain-containing fimbrial protein [Gemmatimonadaceae bacterium]
METVGVPHAPGTSIPGNVIKRMTDLNGGAVVPGDTLLVNVTVSNLAGSSAALALVLRDPLPAQLRYVPGTIVVVTGSNAGPQSDAANDDQGQFDVAQNRVRVRLGVGATAVNGGMLAPGTSTSVQFRAVVKATTTAGTVISNSASVVYLEQLSGPETTAPSSPVGGPVGPTTVVVSTGPGDVAIAKSHQGNLVLLR